MKTTNSVLLKIMSYKTILLYLVALTGLSPLGWAGTNHPPMGEGKGIYPGRVVWVYDPKVSNWNGPGDGHFWETNRTDQKRVDEMLSRALRELTGEQNDKNAWDKLFVYYNSTRGKGNVGYKQGEKINIKVNFVGFILGGGNVNPQTHKIEKRLDYMNTTPQVILALLKQLVNVVGVKQSDITVGDGLTYFATEYYEYLHNVFPDVVYLDGTGQLGRTKIKPSNVGLYWSCRPQTQKQDYIPTCFVEADYMINLANLKAHTGAGVTLCAKNHFGSVIRKPVENGYYDMHRSTFAKETKIYRPLVDLMGHSQIGGKTFLYLIDGLYSGKHPIDPAPRKWNSQPFNGNWTSSLFASQDPVAIDSVGLDFLRAEWKDYPSEEWVDDYLHEAAMADNPPSGTFYDPNHPQNTTRLKSLGVHEHWNNPVDKKYSKNLGKTNGIELISVFIK